MSQRKYEYPAFTGALQQRSTTHIKERTEVRRVKNVDFWTVIGAMRRRMGAQGDAEDYELPKLPVDAPTLGAFIARFPSAVEVWAAQDNDDVSPSAANLAYWNGPDPDDWIYIATDIPDGSEVNMIDDLDEVWVSSYDPIADSIGDPFTVDEDHDISTTRHLDFAPAARFYVEFNGSIWAANVEIGADRFRDRIYKSSGPTGAFAFVRSPQTLSQTVALPTDYSGPLEVDSVRYVKAGQVIDIYEAGTDTLLYTLTVASVDKILDTVTFVTPDTVTFANTDITTATDIILLPSATPWMATGTPVTFWMGSALPAGLAQGGVYYVIRTTATLPVLEGPAAGSDDATVGVQAWTNPGNVTADDGTLATVTLAGPHDESHYLKALNFGFAIPGGSTIEGVVAHVERKSDGSGIQSDSSVKLVKGGSIVGSNRSTGASIPGTLTTEDYGSPSDLWGTTLSVADVNAANFGFVYSASEGTFKTVSVDYMSITVYYRTANGIKLATTRANALAGTPVVDITTQGTGTHRLTFTPVFGNKDEFWKTGRKGKLSRFWNTDYRNPETSDYLKLPATFDALNDIVGVGTISNRLFLFTANAMFRYDSQNLVPLRNDVGCAAHKSIAYYDSFMVWLDSKGHIWMRNEEAGEQDIISESINETLKLVPQSQLTEASAICSDGIYKLYLGQVDGKSLRVVYNFRTNQWSEEWWTPKMIHQFEYTFDGSIHPHFFDEIGQLWVDEEGNDDNGEVITMEAELGDDTFEVDEVKAYKGIKVYSENSAGSKIYARVDKGEWKPVGQITKPVQAIVIKDLVNGTLLNLRFTNSSNDEPPQIDRVVVWYTPEEDTFRATQR